MNMNDPFISAEWTLKDLLCLRMPVATGLTLSVVVRMDHKETESVRLMTASGAFADVDAFGVECPECNTFEDLLKYMTLAKAYAIRKGFVLMEY